MVTNKERFAAETKIKRLQNERQYDQKLAELLEENEKQTVVIAAVPPRTIRIAGRFIKVPGEPPKNIAKQTRKKAMIIPIIVAKSMDLRTGEMRKVSVSAISLPYSLLV